MDQGWTQPPAAPHPTVAAFRPPGAAFRPIVVLLGVIWLFNAGFQCLAWVWQAPAANPGAAKAGLPLVLAKAVAAAPDWLHPGVLAIANGIDNVGARGIAVAMVAVAVLLGLALITNIGLRFAACFGVAYSIFCWVALCAMGAPYGPGQTDPGVFPAYMIAFVFVLAVAPAVAPRRTGTGLPSISVWAIGRVLFASLWAFDAALKWEPYFLTHFMDQLTPAVQGQPHWIAAYITFVSHEVQAIGPMIVALIVAIIETGIALSLLTGWLLRVVAPLGFLYSLAVWTTAEGWGGPYTTSGTGIRGDVIGNALLYAVIFMFFMVPAAPRLWERRVRAVAV